MGQATVIELPRQCTAKVKMEERSVWELHLNKVKLYVARVEKIGLTFDQGNEFDDLHYAPTDSMKMDWKDVC